MSYLCPQRAATRLCIAPAAHLTSSARVGRYAMALEHHGEDKVHQHVGREPSGRNFNARVLNESNLPHNPMINAGAIMTASLVRPDLKLADRWDHVIDTWERLAGGQRPGFAHSTYLSESASADRNWYRCIYISPVTATHCRTPSLPVVGSSPQVPGFHDERGQRISRRL